MYQDYNMEWEDQLIPYVTLQRRIFVTMVSILPTYVPPSISQMLPFTTCIIRNISKLPRLKWVNLTHLISLVLVPENVHIEESN